MRQTLIIISEMKKLVRGHLMSYLLYNPFIENPETVLNDSLQIAGLGFQVLLITTIHI